MSLAESLPKSAARPADAKELDGWRKAETARIRAVVRPIPGTIVAEEISKSSIDNIDLTQWKFSVGEEWHVPAVEFARGNPAKTAMILCDEGRKNTAGHVKRLLSEGFRVIACDPFYFNSSSRSRFFGGNLLVF